MVAANDGINHETGYGREHEKKKASEGHYIPLLYHTRFAEVCRGPYNTDNAAYRAAKCDYGIRQMKLLVITCYFFAGT